MLKPQIKYPYYEAVGDEELVLQCAYRNCLPLMLKGPTGCGKSRFVEAMAARLGRPLISVACNEDTSATDLLGRYLIQGGDTVWQDGPVTRALREGAILYLDEISEAREDVIVVLHPLTDHRRTITLDKRNEEIKASPEFMLIVSFNPGYQKGLKELKPSTRQRFVAIHFDYPKAELETEIVSKEAQCSLEIAKKLVKFGHKIRNLKELGLTETASTRLLVDAGKLMRDGLEARLACDVAIIQPLTDDGDVMIALRDVAAMIF
ncbi:CbbQ/NirQ/NorQ/GpvN family protein [Bdellovibrio svalbardensis]|uniref:CbbQ/NirQ/NorQ/GpvN family protein n=1 Tax=Bdellovibrio svalbardensis TaxID=2972972 RepID=A0ABT6DLI4_9BACT|nr:CbbQ/NirQ/NorQ/GpvN family protein [Bdellovibrio svalbardensis]MDG0816935.1 CbbQ/NirQ/NorQ/GpvN family protein [Bdellovibrio svalbardensis]